MSEFLEERLIRIKPERQRKDLGDLAGLKRSIDELGIINPIVVEENLEEPGTFWVIAGERRLTAFRALMAENPTFQQTKVPVRFFSNLDEATRQMIELEENIKRKDLTWQENVAAIMKVKELKGIDTGEELAFYLGVSPSHITRVISAWNMRDNEKVWGAENLSAAYTICKRESARIFGSATSDLNFMIQNFLGEEEDGQDNREGKTGTSSQGTQSGGISAPANADLTKNRIRQGTDGGTGEDIQDDTGGIHPLEKSVLYPKFAIQTGDFLAWAESYKGPAFNLLHLDFPYGINHDRSKQGNTKNFGTYSDTEDIYKTLVRGLLENQDHLIASSAHCICWLSLRFAEWTRKEFEKAGWSCHLQPFIWHKSDNKGIIADTMCGMRNVGEYALIFNRGRRPVIKNISNIFPSPTTKTFHASEKPLPVLEYLFSAFCDEHSRVLDPTCGSGTAIQTALKMGAEEALGIELDEEFAEKAKTWLEDFKKTFSVKENIELDFNLDL